MKKNIFYCVVFFAVMALAMPANAAAKRKKQSTRYYDTHFIDAWVGGGYSGLVNGYQGGTIYDVNFDPKFIGGGGGLIGFGYEYHYKRFMLNVGPEFRMFSSTDKLMLDGPLQAYRTDYTSMLQHFEFDKFRETNAVGQIMLPVMFGGTFDKVYFLAGAKVGYTLLHSWKHRGNLTTSVTDDMAYDDEWNDLLSHYILTDKVQKHPLNNTTNNLRGKNPFGLDIVLSAEVGVNLNDFLPAKWNKDNDKSKHPHHFRVAAFVDYGLWNMNVAQAGTSPNLVVINPVAAEDGLSESTSLHQSPYAEDKRVNSLLAGVKGTWLLQLNKPTGRKPPLPTLAVTVTATDPDTVHPLKGATLSVQNLAINKKTKTMKKAKAFTVGNGGVFSRTFQVGDYNVWATAPGYFPSDTVFDYNLFEPAIPESRKEKPLPQRLSFNLVKIPVWNATVKDATTDQPINATLHVVSEGLIDTVVTGESARIVFADKKYLNQTYRVMVTADDYHSSSFTVSGNDIYNTSNFTLTPLVKILRTFDLQHMYFATNKTEILPTSEEDLQYLYKVMSENPKIRILITGHTDSQGSDEFNQRLSEGRSASVKAEMVKRGIDASRIETDGKGESEPVDTNATDEGRQHNRRVQITILNPEDAEVDIY